MLHLFAHTVAQTYYTYSAPTDNSSGLLAFPVLMGSLLGVVVLLIAMWRLFTKAGKPGWAAIVPIYNSYVLLQIVGRPWWWLLLFLVPLVNFIVGLVVYYDLAKAFGKGVGTFLLLVLVPIIGFPWLAFGDSKYTGPAAKA